MPRVAQVDSEAVAALVAFSKVKPWEFLTEIYGTAALAWLSANDSRTLHLARVNSSPLWLGQAHTGSLFYGSTQETVENAAIMSDTELDWIYEAQEGEYFRVRDGRIEEYQTFTPSRRASYWYDYPATTSKTTKHDIDLFTSSGTLIFDQRNKLVETAIENKADYLLFVDADMRFPKDTLKILMAHDKDIIGVNATTRAEPVSPTARNIHINEDGSVDWVAVYSNAKEGIEKVDGIGCGIMLIKQSVIKKMEKPYFYFEQLLNNKILGEDIYFCIKAKDAGVDTWVDHNLSKEIKHIGQYVYGWHNIELPKD